PTSRVRAIMETETGHDATFWRELVDLGITGLTVPSSHGGAGLELLDLALAAEELGRAAAPGPFLGAAMATVALVESTDESAKGRWLPKIAAGEGVVTVAFGAAGSEWGP